MVKNKNKGVKEPCANSLLRDLRRESAGVRLRLWSFPRIIAVGPIPVRQVPTPPPFPYHPATAVVVRLRLWIPPLRLAVALQWIRDKKCAIDGMNLTNLEAESFLSTAPFYSPTAV